jgi:hypothetical protein
MSKTGSNKKHPVPDNKMERFMALVYVLASDYGIEENEDVYHYVQLLGDAVSRQVFEQNHKVSPQKKVHLDRKRFIAIFKTRYQQLLDLEYTKKFTPVEMKLVNQANKLLLKEGFTVDEFLAWFFEEFLVDNEKFSPPTVKSLCSQFILHSFLTANRELKEAKKKKELEKKMALDLIQRARGLMRCSMEEKHEKKIGKALKEYGERRIMLIDFRKIVESLESIYGINGN